MKGPVTYDVLQMSRNSLTALQTTVDGNTLIGILIGEAKSLDSRSKKVVDAERCS